MSTKKRQPEGRHCLWGWKSGMVGWTLWCQQDHSPAPHWSKTRSQSCSLRPKALQEQAFLTLSPHSPPLVAPDWRALCTASATAPTPVLLPGESRGRGSLVGCSPWGHYESHTTERLHFHFSPSCIGEGNGNPLQCSCLENPGDGGAWWAAIYGLHRVGHDWSDLAALAAVLSDHKSLYQNAWFAPRFYPIF